MGMLKGWKGPKINKKFLVSYKKKRLSKKVEILPCFLSVYFKKKIMSTKLLGFELGKFFLNKKASVLRGLHVAYLLKNFNQFQFFLENFFFHFNFFFIFSFVHANK